MALARRLAAEGPIVRNRNHVQFDNKEIAAQIAERARDGQSLGSVAARDLDRYYALLAREYQTLRLTEAEENLVRDACNGTQWDVFATALVWAAVDDGIRVDHLDQKWGVNGPALVQRLRMMTVGQSIAVVDAVERFWITQEKGG